MRDVVISIRSTHRVAGEEPDQIEFSTDGIYRHDGEKSHIMYYESEVTGLQGTKTSVDITPEKVTVTRKGLIQSEMIFEEGGHTSFQYGTPYGFATLGVDTRRITHHFTPEGGEMTLDFVLNMEHAVVTQNTFEITVKKIGE